MPLFLLNKDDLLFPSPHLAPPSGLLAIGGDLRPERLLLGYQSGIFPWYSADEPIQWWSPDPRFVLYPDGLQLSRTMRKTVARRVFTLRMDQRFDEVIRQCAVRPRPGQGGTWITRAMQRAYIQLFELGFAHSIEAYQGERLVGGLYGVSLGHIFFGESMFFVEPDASKVAFVMLVEQVKRWGFRLIDSQLHTPHVERFGGREIPRAVYLQELHLALSFPTRQGRWVLDPDLTGKEAE